MKLSALTDSKLSKKDFIRAAVEQMGSGERIVLHVGLRTKSNLIGEDLALEGEIISFDDTSVLIQFTELNLNDATSAGGPYSKITHPYKARVKYDELRLGRGPEVEFVLK